MNITGEHVGLQGSSVSNISSFLRSNDLPAAVPDVLIYADDVAAVVCESSIDRLEQKLNIVASKISGWLGINGLVLNLTKTCTYISTGHSYRSLKVTRVGC